MALSSFVSHLLFNLSHKYFVLPCRMLTLINPGLIELVFEHNAVQDYVNLGELTLKFQWSFKFSTSMYVVFYLLDISVSVLYIKYDASSIPDN